MNEWIKMLFPLIGVLLGWGLSERGKIYSDRRQDKRKLKRLLFYLLELRYHFSKELNLELDLDKCITLLKNKLSQKFGVNNDDPELNVGVDKWKPLLIDLISKSQIQSDQLLHLENNIDNVLNDLAEIAPILAYELNGQHKIKERLTKSTTYINELADLINDMPFDFEEWFKPKLTKDILADLDNSIDKVSSSIDKKTKEAVKKKLEKMDSPHDDTDMDKFLDDYLERLNFG